MAVLSEGLLPKLMLLPNEGDVKDVPTSLPDK